MNISNNLRFIPNIYSIALMTIVLSSCSKSGTSTPPSPSTPVTIQITGLSPNEAQYNAEVDIYGSGFNASANLDTVLFNGKSAIVASASYTELIVQVPYLAGNGNIVVKTGTISKTAGFFTYDY